MFCSANNSFLRCARQALSSHGVAFRAHARIHYIVCANCLHSFTDGGEGLKIRGIGVKANVKAKVKENSEDIEVKSKGRKGESGRCEVFFCGW